MEISVTDAEGQLTDLVRKAEAGDEVVLTRHGQPAVRLVPIHAQADAKFDPAKRRAILEAIAKEAGAKATPGPSAARSQDFLYGDDGLPG